MIQDNRIILYKGGNYSDISHQMSDLYSGSIVLNLDSNDKIYIGSDFPFNHRYFKMKVNNSNSVNVTVKHWDGNSFVNTVDNLDMTSVSGATFGKSGIIQFTVDKDEVWDYDNTEDITPLSSFRIYDLYWAELSFSGTLSNTTEIEYIGQRFCSSDELYGYYPSFVRSEMLTTFKAGKTNWDDQCILASEEIVLELRKMKTIHSRNQLVDWQILGLACIHKTASIIFSSFGSDFDGEREKAILAYKSAIGRLDFNIDKDGKARLEPKDRFKMSGLFRS